MGTFGWGKVQKVTSAPHLQTKQNRTKHEANMEMGQKLKFDKVPLEHSPSKDSNLAH